MYDLFSVQDPFLQKILHLNPMTSIIQSYHYILSNHIYPPVTDIAIPMAEGIIMVLIGYWVFRKLNRRFVEEL